MGQISLVECLALTACILLGALLGSLGVYVYHLPHFKTLPEPAPVNAEDALLRSRDAVSRNALKCALMMTALPLLHVAGRCALSATQWVCSGLWWACWASRLV